MKWAAVSLVALSALSAPAVAQAQDDMLTASATAALRGLGEAFLNSCFPGRPDPRPLRIALAEIAVSQKLSDAAARTITDRIEAALERDPLFAIVPRRLSSELGVIRKELQESGPLAPGGPLDGFVTIKPDADAAGQAAVMVTLYTADLNCQRGAAAAVRVGNIKESPDDPDAFFKFAARDLDERQIERLLVMPPDIGIDYGNRGYDMARHLQERLAKAIRGTFEYRRRLHLNDAPVPSVGLFGEGMAPDGAWRAKMRLRRSGRGIEVDVQFSSPDNPPHVIDAPTGLFSSDILPASLDQFVLRMPAVKTLKVKEDPFEVRIELLKGPSHLFCFYLEPNGEATLVYPMTLAANVFTAGEKRFPNDFFPGMTKSWTVDEPNDFFLHCAATRGTLPEDLQRRWLQNTVPARKGRREKESVDPVLANEIISALRQSEGYAEAATEIVSK
jgi:hypothetical protein